MSMLSKSIALKTMLMPMPMPMVVRIESDAPMVLYRDEGNIAHHGPFVKGYVKIVTACRIGE